MTIKVYTGSAWQPQKSLKISPDGSTWSTAKKGWIYNGSSWSQFYPEYPSNSVSPAVSGSTTQGQTLTCSTGTWDTNDAFLGTYSYQWTRAGSDISGATSSTYTTVVADVGNAVACKVTATNNRGATTVTSSNSITIISANVSNTVAPATGGSTYYNGVATVNTGTWAGSPNSYAYQWYNASSGTAISGATSSSLTIPASVVGAAVWCLVTATNTSTGSSASAYSNSFIALPIVTGLSVTDGTSTPGAPSSVTVTITGQTTANVSWGAGSGNISFYDGYASVGTLGSFNSSARTASITGGTAGSSTTVYIRSANYNGVVTGSWNSLTGTAVSVTYDIYIDGTYVANTSSNSYSYTQGNTGVTKTMLVIAKVGSTSGSSQSGNATLSTKYSGYTTGSGTFNSSAVAPSTPTNLVNTYSGGPSWTGTWSASTGTAPITYYWTLYQSTSNGGTVTATASGNTTSTTFTQAMSSGNGLWAYFTVYASNSAGNSGTATSSWV